MNPVIRLEVSKGESHAQVFSDRGTPYGKERPYVCWAASGHFVRSNGHYHSPVIQFLDEHQYLMNLHYLTWLYESLTEMYVQAKLQFQAVLDQIFPEYHGVFDDLYSKVSLRILAQYPPLQTMLAMSEENVTMNIQRLVGHVASNRWSLERTQKLMAAAERNPFRETAFHKYMDTYQGHPTMNTFDVRLII